MAPEQPEKNQIYSGKTVIVTGAANGIGRAVAKAFAAEDARVILADIDAPAGGELERSLNASGANASSAKVSGVNASGAKASGDNASGDNVSGDNVSGDNVSGDNVSGANASGANALFLRTDVSKPESIRRMIAETVAKTGHVDILINNAGIAGNTPFDKLSLADWDHVLNTNLRGAFLCSQEAARHMSNGGAIVNMASTRATMSEPDWEAYAASKGGLLSLTHAMALSLAPKKITVNAISPGWIHTRNPKSLRKIDHSQHPAGRVGKPEDIARACLFLCHPENRFITGEQLVIDGGMTRKMIYEH